MTQMEVMGKACQSASDGRTSPAPLHRAHLLIAALLLIVCAAPLLVGSLLNADKRGLGTHEQLGLPPCGFLLATGMPCATCGMTTSFTLAAKGRLLEAFVAQPCGAALALFAAIMVVVSGYALVRNVSLVPLLVMLWRPPTVLALVVLAIGAWGYKIAMVSYFAVTP